MNATLQQIIDAKRQSVEKKKAKYPQARLVEMAAGAPAARDFFAAISAPGEVNIIGEIKRASPSAGVIRKDFDTTAIAQELALGGAKAISVLTEEKHFQGDLYTVLTAKEVTSLPVLRKDFMIDDYQIYESRAYAADAVLLITSILDDASLERFLRICSELKLEALVEVHTEEELGRALKFSPRLVGINNRDLNDFSVDINRCFRLKKLVPAGVTVVCESGIKTPEHIGRLKENGINAALIGETLMKSPDIAAKLRELRRG